MPFLRLIIEVRSGGSASNISTNTHDNRSPSANVALENFATDVQETLNYLPGFLRATPALVTSASREILHSATQTQTYRELARGVWHELPGFMMEISLAVLGGRVGGFLGQGATTLLGKGPVGFMARSLLTAWGMRVTGEAVELLLGQRQSLELFKTRDLLSMFGVAAGDVVGARVHHALQSRVQSRAMSAAASYVYSRISGGLVMNYSAVLEISLGKLFNAATGTNFFSTMHEEHIAEHLTLRSMAMGVVKDFAIHSGNRAFDRTAQSFRTLWNSDAHTNVLSTEKRIELEAHFEEVRDYLRGLTQKPEQLALAGGATLLGDMAINNPHSITAASGVALGAAATFKAVGSHAETAPLRFHLPTKHSKYFREMATHMAFTQLAGYAEARRRFQLVGANIENRLKVELNGPYEYSPYGAVMVEIFRELGRPQGVNEMTAKWERALVISPATAILGLGHGLETRDHTLHAESADIIMEGKAKYFLWTAGVRTDPQCATIEYNNHERAQLREMDRSLKSVQNLHNQLKENSANLENVRRSLRNEVVKISKRRLDAEKINQSNLRLKLRQVPLLEYLDKQMNKPLSDLNHEQLTREVADIEHHIKKDRDRHIQRLRALKFAEIVKGIGGNYGFINIEDAQGSDLELIFDQLHKLRKETAVWSDDRQGTGVITAAGTLSWAAHTNRDMSKVRGVIHGAGAGARGVYDELVNHGVKPENILVVDSRGPLTEARHDLKSDAVKNVMCEGISEGVTEAQFLKGADFFINLGSEKTITQNHERFSDWLKSMAENPMVALLTNPEPGMSPDQLRAIREDAYYASGNQRYENTLNNFAAFGYVGAGVLWSRSASVNKEMTVAAAQAISRLAQRQEGFGKRRLVPRHDDLALITEEALAVAIASVESGNSQSLAKNASAQQRSELIEQLRAHAESVRRDVEKMRVEVREKTVSYFTEKYGERYAPFALHSNAEPYYHVAPLLNLKRVRSLLRRMDMPLQVLNEFKQHDMALRQSSMTEALRRLRNRIEEMSAESRERNDAEQELRILTLMTSISPDMAMALVSARLSQISSNPTSLPRTVFHDRSIRNILLDIIPEAQRELETVFEDISLEIRLSRTMAV